MHKPEDNQTAENLARLKVSVNRTIAKNRQDPEKDTEKAILYKSLDKLTLPPAVTAGSGVERDVAAFNISGGSVNDLSGEFQKLRAELQQEFRDEMKSLREKLSPQVASPGKVPSRQFESNTYVRPTSPRIRRHIRDFFSRPRENLNPFLLPEGQTKEKTTSNRLLARTLGQFAG